MLKYISTVIIAVLGVIVILGFIIYAQFNLKREVIMCNFGHYMGTFVTATCDEVVKTNLDELYENGWTIDTDLARGENFLLILSRPKPFFKKRIIK